MKFPPIEEQLNLIRLGTEEIIPEELLIKKLKHSRANDTPLNVKLGCDPSRPDLHIGHAVVLRKLRHFQDLGHNAILVIGDFTAMIGDPSGRNKTRPQLTIEEAKNYAKTYVDQSEKILDIKTLKVRYNSTWLSKMNFNDVVKLSSSYTVARMLERDDFTKRFQSEIPISIHEFLYPLAQGQDSVELNADVELGGTDQKFNLLVGRDLQKQNNQDPQCIITLPLLEGTDGVEKMSKSYGNHIGFHDRPEDMYGKTLSIKDDMILKWFTLAVNTKPDMIKEIESKLLDPTINPMIYKRELARKIVESYYDSATAEKAENYFNTVVVGKGVPDDIPTFKLESEDLIVNVIFNAGILKSKGEARRLIKQGAVKLNSKRIVDIKSTISSKDDQILKIGKRRFLKVI
ncbi:MAG: tyrosine--tRNA ligase [Candidatus Neomarinimicrobiota bacterium]